MQANKDVTIVSLIALPEEFAIFQKIFPFKADHTSDTRLCIEHQSGAPGVRLISVLAEEMGAQSARDSAIHSISSFDPDLVVVIGIAGAISSDLSVGDVCVSNEIFDVLNNNKVSDNKGKTEISFSPDVFNVDAELVSSFRFLVCHPKLIDAYNNWRKKISSKITDAELNKEISDLPKLLIAPIACGPVSASPKFNDRLRKLNRKIAAIETESGGIFQELSRKKIPAIAIRGISDLADDKKADLELRTKGLAREMAMENAAELLSLQIKNDWFVNVAKRYSSSRVSASQQQLFANEKITRNPVAELEKEIRSHLKDCCPDFRTRPDGFYLPVPRATRITYTEDLDGSNVEGPEEIVDCLKKNDRIIVKMPRSFPSQALGWALAHSLIRQDIDGRVVLPFVVNGRDLKPPKCGLENSIPKELEDIVNGSQYIHVFIIEEPCFESRTRIKFLNEQIQATDAKVIILTKSEENVASIESFVYENSANEYELTPVSFSETAFFLERAFDMPPHEAEAVAIKLDDTFRKFNLDAHPAYFAGLQEETIAAFIHANKRAELIQLAVDSLLTLIVVADMTKQSLSRTTRERFLKRLVLEMAVKGGLDDNLLSKMASEFLAEHKFPVSQTEFLNPFFQVGLLYQADGKIKFTHHYLESYLLSQSLKENPSIAKSYFDPSKQFFDFYAFDLYCEMGPDQEVISAIITYADHVCKCANETYTDGHVYLSADRPLTSISSASQIKSFASRLVNSAEKMGRKNVNDDVRAEKQRILDAKRRVRSKVNKRDDDLPEEFKAEFEMLDGLSRSLSLCAIAVGSGSESLNGSTKVVVSRLVLQVANKFTDIWTRNRLRIDFESTRREVLSDKWIWDFMEDIGAEDTAFEDIKADLELFLSESELRMVLEPMRRVMWRISSCASAKVLAPVLQEVETSETIGKIIQACWYHDVNPEAGKKSLKGVLSDYKGNSLLRLALASHLLGRLYWHHYNTRGAEYFVASARRSLLPLGLKPSKDRIEQAKRGASQAS